MFESISKQIIELSSTLILEYGFSLIKAIFILVIGFWITKKISFVFRLLLEKKEFDKTLTPFLTSLLSMALKVMIVISAITTMGIQMTSFIAILGAAGLAIGMALSGTLQNFAGGVMILFFKPFEVGHVIEAQGFLGTVREIQIFSTILKTPENKTIIIPNGGLSTGSLTNYSIEPKRRLEWVVGVAYGEKIEKVKGVIETIIAADERILKEEGFEHAIVVSGLADSSVNFTIRAWVNSENFGAVLFEMNEKIYNSFNEANIGIPFPQMDVHVHQK